MALLFVGGRRHAAVGVNVDDGHDAACRHRQILTGPMKGAAKVIADVTQSVWPAIDSEALGIKGDLQFAFGIVADAEVTAELEPVAADRELERT